MSSAIHLAVDGMGGDQGPRLALSACRLFLQRHPGVQISLFGDLSELLELQGKTTPGLSLVAASQVVAMDEKPAYALRHKQNSSMWLAIAAVASGSAQACVSGGNTGALVALSRHILGTLPELSRPAICKPIPTKSGVCWMLDLGANLDASAEALLAFAKLGAQLAASQLGHKPRVALLNIGTEADKGPENIRAAASLLHLEAELKFVGFVEAGEIYTGSVDVLVCDGFTGNVALKASEGAARFLFGQLREALQKSFWMRCLGWLLKPTLKSLHAQLNPSSLNGALLLGLKGNVVKSHGAADLEGYVSALSVALAQAKQQLNNC